MDDARIEAQVKAAIIKQNMVGYVYRHFKGNYYKVINIAVHSETAEVMVIYKNDDNEVWARPYNMFISEVDHEKYPDSTQKMRFEKICKSDKW